MQNRQQFFQRQASILAMAESLLLDSADGDLTLDDLATSLEIAKGTLYKHFTSKDELYLYLLIDYEKQLFECVQVKDGASATLARMVLLSLLNPRKAMFYHWLEERLSAYSVGQKPLFDELYRIRKERMAYLLSVADVYLEELESPMSAGDYLPTLWAIGQGGASLLNSSFYQRYLGSREHKIFVWLQQALTLPKLPKALHGLATEANVGLVQLDAQDEQEISDSLPQKPEPTLGDEYRPFGKLIPPTL